MKTLRDKDKLLVTSNFSFSLIVFPFIATINFPPFSTTSEIVVLQTLLHYDINCRLEMNKCPYNLGPHRIYELSYNYEPSMCECRSFSVLKSQ